MKYRVYLLLIACLWLPTAMAHTASTAYLWLSPAEQTQGLTGEWHVALRDVVRLVKLDSNDDGVIKGRELKAQGLLIQQTLQPYLQINDCHINMRDTLIDNHAGENYVVLRFSACDELPSNIDITYTALFDIDKLHRAILYWQDTPYLLSPEHHQYSLNNKTTTSNNWQTFTTYIQQGVWHIWIGFDHWLFLLTLLLPAVLIYRRPQWQAVTHFKPALFELIRIVTAFTIAHSITLSLTVLGWLTPPAFGIESLIALSVIVVALNNLYPLVNQRRWTLAFAFGLLHGFGFASVLNALSLSPQNLGISLLGFNLGVELGQMVIVLIYFPIAYSLRHTRLYQWIFLKLGSISAAGIASIWLFQRLSNGTLPL